MTNKTTLVIVDDHQMVAQGIAGFFKEDPEFEVVGIFESATEAFPRIRILLPDIVLTDLDMPGMNGLEFAEHIQKNKLPCKIVLLTMHLNQAVVKKAMAQKLNGYLPKNAGATEMKACLLSVREGNDYYSALAIQVLTSSTQEIKPSGLKKSQRLSEREKEILKLIAEGMNTRMISEELFISIRTVETHRKAILEKLDVNNVAGMVRIAVQEGLLD